MFRISILAHFAAAAVHLRFNGGRIWCRLLVVDLERFVSNKDNGHILLRSCAVLHYRPFRKPHEIPGAVLPVVGLESPLQDVHAVSTWMCVQRIDGARRVTNEANLHSRIRILDQVLAIERAANSLVGTFLPWHRVAVYDREFDV
jgi:hypothetical protein